MFRCLTFAFAALIAFSTMLSAQIRLDDVVSLEVIDGGQTKEGQQRAALRIRLAEGWHTYWRAPGDAGIPPDFDWRGSRNVAGVYVSWPTPRVYRQHGTRSIVYKREMVLPLSIRPKRPGQAIVLKGGLDIGICKDVCLPVSFRLDHRIAQGSERNPVIAAALASRPYTAREAGVTSATCRITPTAQGLQVTAEVTMPSAGGREEVVIEAGDPQIWSSEPQARRLGDVLVATSDLVHMEDSGGFVLDRSQMRITVLGARHAVDIQGCTGE